VDKPFIILLDLQMPERSCLEFLEALRGSPEFHDSVIFVLITSKAEEDIVSSYKKLIAGYFVKERLGFLFLTLLICQKVIGK
jgi:CheY-like chemotaxis protein